MNDVDYLTKYLRVEKDHQLNQKIAELTFRLKFFNEFDLLTISEQSCSFDGLINGLRFSLVSISRIGITALIVESG